MPSPLHQGVLFLLKSNPGLVFEFARRFDPGLEVVYTRFEEASNELPDPAASDTILHADWLVAAVDEESGTTRRVFGLAVEVQTCHDPLKRYSWLSHAAGARRRFRCPGWTLVFAPDPVVRRRAQKMFAAEPRASPWFVEPHMMPPIVEARWAARDIGRASLTGLFHARSERGVACARATLEAARPLAWERRWIYVELVRASLKREQLEQLPRSLFDIDDEAPLGPMELSGAYYVRGHREGHQQGLEQGLAQGHQQGRLLEARALLVRVLERRGLHPDAAQRRRIDACTQLEQLESWLDRALVASHIAHVFE